MTQEKAWYASKTIWGSLIAVAAAIASAFGLDINEEAQSLMIDAILQIVAVGGSIFAIMGRMSATQAIEK